MRRIGAVVALGVLVVSLPVGRTSAADPASGRPAGERVAVTKGCGECHALPGEAPGKRPGPAFVAPAPPLASSEVLRRLWNHIPGMRHHFLARGLAWPVISAKEMGYLLTFLGMQPGLGGAPNLDRGRLLLVRKGCLKCHSLDGEGARAAPDLVRFRQFGSPVPLAAALWSKAPVMLQQIDRSGIPYPIFGEGEMRDLLGFLGAIADVSR